MESGIYPLTIVLTDAAGKSTETLFLFNVWTTEETNELQIVQEDSNETQDSE